MPRYNYQCNECDDIVIVFHGINEVVVDCSKCEAPQTMKKLLSVPTIIKKHEKQSDVQIGTVTHEHIEANREILKQQKKEARKMDYEPS